ncbi:MAG: DUF1670 domain-containing protein, partial [Planctomycetes bacterium]|nr:DUF1670 domain-containing protein [Planctomycetota bacterium]
QEKDIGRTLTHKPLIIRKLFLEGKSVEAVCRQTHHSPEAVHRYIEAFKRVLLLRRNGLSAHDIAYAVHMTPLLVAEYNRLINQLGEENALLKHLLLSKRKEV